MIVSPIAPKIPTQLNSWGEPGDSLLEIDQSLVEGADFTDTTRINVDSSRLVGVSMTGAILEKFECSDTEWMKLEAAALQAYRTNLLRVTMADCRLTDAEFAEGHFEDCMFKNVKFDEAGFRFASFKRVRFENCILRAGDFSNAKLSQVTFTGCDLEGAHFVSASCANVDLTAEDVTTVKGILGLKGATISLEQLIQLAPLLATELGFQIKD